MRINLLRLFALILALGVGAVLSAPAFAQTTTKSVSLTRVAKLGGQELAKGKYSISFDNEKDGEAVILKDGQEVSKASYKLIRLEKDASDNAIVFTAAEDGSLKIKRIELKGSKTALSFE